MYWFMSSGLVWYPPFSLIRTRISNSNNTRFPLDQCCVVWTHVGKVFLKMLLRTRN
ncbi:hypothetical protein Hanom_Chr17g01528411 [Helianthus anomalus]